MKIFKTKNTRQIIFIAILVLSITLAGYRETSLYSKYPTRNINREQFNPKKAGFWIVDPFVIDEDELNPSLDYTWAEAVLEPWCSGSGSWNDPYIIENILINHSGSPFPTHYQSCIKIMRSRDVYFIIRNSTFKNAFYSGINLEITNNGLLEGNIFSYTNGITLWEGRNNTITNNQFCNSTQNIGIKSRSGGNNTISNNLLQDLYHAIKVEYNEKVYNNVILRCGANSGTATDNWAMLIGGNNHIRNNTILNSTLIGMEVFDSNNLIENNTIGNSGSYGIFQYGSDSSYNLIKGNIIKNNKADGLHLHDYAGDHNTVFNNIFVNNSQRGVYVDTIHNLFYNNSFIGNEENVFDMNSNSWNYSSLGNYWDDYTGEDADEDGIGDVPYPINSQWYGVFDYYPIWDDGPDVIIESPINNEIFRELPPNFTITFNYPDLDKIWYTLNYSMTRFIVESNGTIDSDAWSAIEEGNVTIRFYANSTSNITKFKELYVIKDISNPDLYIHQPENELFGINAPPYNITVEDLSLNSVWYTLNGGINNFTITQFNGTVDQSFWSSLPDGNISFRFYANDKVGHINYDEVKVIKDTKNPAITVFEPISNQIFGDLSPTFNLSISDLHLDSFWYMINNETTIFRMNSTQGTIDSSLWNSLLDGNHIITFYANDSVGNTVIVKITIVKVRGYLQPLIIYGFDLAIIILILCFISIIFVFSKKKLYSFQ